MNLVLKILLVLVIVWIVTCTCRGTTNGNNVKSSIKPSEVNTVTNGTMNIVLYGYDGCGYTRKLKQEFDNKNITYMYKQIDKNQEYNDEYKKFNKQGVPLTVNTVNGKNIIGYNTAENIINQIK